MDMEELLSHLGDIANAIADFQRWAHKNLNQEFWDEIAGDKLKELVSEDSEAWHELANAIHATTNAV